MTIQYLSDLHLEFRDNQAFIQKNPIVAEADVLLLAGDIMPLRQLRDESAFLDQLSAQFQAVYWVPGNHEYYNTRLSRIQRSMKSTIRDNVFMVNNYVEVLSGVRFIFSTLWTKISDLHALQIQNRLSDFHAIELDGRPFSVWQYNALHEDSLAFLTETLQTPFEGPSVVVTHHVPTYMHYPAQYKGDILNEAFAVELFDLIANHGPEYWIFGHHHSNMPAFTLGKTQMLTNQLGYISRGENEGFSMRKTFVLE